MTAVLWKSVPTRTVDVGGTDFAFRELGAGQSVLVANGDNDLTVYPDPGHGGVFQHHQLFVPEALAFLNGSEETT